MLQALLASLAEALDRRGIPYMVIGGQAVLQYGEPRLTRDIDVTLGVDTDRIAEILQLSDDLQLEPLVDPTEFTLRTMVLPCSAAGGLRVDLIFSFSDYEQQAIEVLEESSSRKVRSVSRAQRT